MKDVMPNNVLLLLGTKLLYISVEEARTRHDLAVTTC